MASITKNLCIIAALALFALLSACGNEARKTAQSPNATQQAPKVEPQQLPSIHIYRYGSFPVAKAKELKAVLEKAYPSVSLAAQPIELPEEHYLSPATDIAAQACLTT